MRRNRLVFGLLAQAIEHVDREWSDPPTASATTRATTTRAVSRKGTTNAAPTRWKTMNSLTANDAVPYSKSRSTHTANDAVAHSKSRSALQHPTQWGLQQMTQWGLRGLPLYVVLQEDLNLSGSFLQVVFAGSAKRRHSLVPPQAALTGRRVATPTQAKTKTKPTEAWRTV
jgi:hypothetical protein